MKLGNIMEGSLRRFVNLYNELIGQLKATFPNVTKVMPDYSKYEDMDFLRDFVVLNLPYIDDIAARNADSFKLRHKKASLIKGLPFSKILEKSPDALTDALFNYLRDLYIAGTETGLMFKLVQKQNDEHILDRMQAIEGEAALLKIFKGMDVNVEDVAPGVEPIIDDDDDEEDDAESGFDPSKLTGLMEQLTSSEIGKVAREVCDGLGEGDVEQMQQFAEHTNPTELLSKLMSMFTGAQQTAQQTAPQTTDGQQTAQQTAQQTTDGQPGVGEQEAPRPAMPSFQLPTEMGAISGLVQRTMSTVQQKIESGEIDMNKIMNDAQGFLAKLSSGGLPFNIPGMPKPSKNQRRKRRN